MVSVDTLGCLGRQRSGERFKHSNRCTLIRNFLEAFRFQADTYDGIDVDQFDAAIIDVDKLTDLQVEVELRVRNKDTSGSRDECRKRFSLGTARCSECKY